MNNSTDKMIWVDPPNEPATDVIGKPPSKLIRYGSTLILILLVLILIFSNFLQLPEVIHAEAFIQVLPAPVIITSPVPGKPASFVHNGQWVAKGTLLMVVGGTAVRSPADGPVAFLKTADSVRTGDTLLAVTDTGRNHVLYFAALHLHVEDAGKIRPGQEVDFILPAFPLRQFGSLRGKVQGLSPLPVDGKYLVTVALSQGLITDTRYRIQDFAYLTGTADIVIKNRSLLERIFKRS